ncbi:MAG: PAS domain S-box protein [Chloroflexales bacterium]
MPNESHIVHDSPSRQSALYNVLHQLTSELDPDVIIQKAVHAIVQINCWQSVGISLPTADGQFWQTRAEDRMVPGEVGKCHPIYSGVIGRTYHSGESQLVANVRTDPDFFLGEDVAAVGSELAVPIIFNGLVLGVINLESDQPAMFGQDDITFAESISAIIAIALKNAQRFAALQQEIAERTQSEARFAAIFQHSPLSIVITRQHDNVMLDANMAWLDLLGFTHEEVVGRTAVDLGIWADPQNRQRMLDILRANGRVADFEAIICKKSGERLHVLISCEQTVIGSDQCILFQLTNITERKRMELALRASEEQYRGLMESFDSVIAAVDGEGRFLYLNNLAAAQIGGTVDSLVGKTMAELFPEPVATSQMRSIRKVIHEDSGVVSERMSWVHGQPRWYRTSIQPIHNEHGQATYVLINATDIHDLKTTQQELLNLTSTLEARVRERTAEVQDLYENAPNGYHSLDADGDYLMVNQTELAWLGYSREEMIGQPLTKFITAQSRDTFQENYPRFMRRGWIRDLELEFVRKDGTMIPALINATAIYDNLGNFVMSRSTVFDNTERKQAEQALQIAYAEIARALRTKDEFLANMSHELRTPLNAIMALSESLREEVRGPLNVRQQESLRYIETSGQHLLTLINDILDMTKLEVGRLELQIETTSIIDVCRASLQFVKEISIKKSLQLSFKLSDELADMKADPKRLKQILVNLLSNAVKFTPPGGKVSLEVETHPELDAVYFMVRDTGIGISAADIGRLFQPFTQLDARLNRQHEGAGLGLALVHRMVDLHGGKITVESTVGQGSCFTIILPYHLATPVPTADVAPLRQAAQAAGIPNASARPTLGDPPHLRPAPTRARILLAEDNEVNMEVVYDYLHGTGYQVVIARSGREAIDQAEAIHPDAILMDIQMPEVDGLEVIRHLRAKPEFASTPIIALTALAMAGDRERCLAAGANKYLSKPVSLRELGELLRQLLEG